MALVDSWIIQELLADGFNRIKGLVSILILILTYFIQQRILTKLWEALRTLAESKLVATELDDRFVEYFETPARLFIWGVGIIMALHFLDVIPMLMEAGLDPVQFSTPELLAAKRAELADNSFIIVTSLLKVCAIMLVAGFFASLFRATLETEGLQYAKAFTPDFEYDDLLFVSGGYPLSLLIYLMGLVIAFQEVEVFTGFLVGHALNLGLILVKIFFGVLVSYVIWSQIDFRGKERLMVTLTEKENKKYAIQVCQMFGQVSRYVYVLLLFLTVVTAAGIDITAWLAGMSFMGLALSFAAKDTLSNILSGVFIILDRPFRKGDYIKLDTGVEGYVETVSLKNMRLRSVSGELITVPNAGITERVIYNQTLASKLTKELASEKKVIMHIGISYDSDFEKAEKILYDILHENEDVMETSHKPPMVFLVELGDFALIFDVEFWSSEGNIKRTKHQINTEVLKRFDKAGIKIPFPTQIEYQVHVDKV